MAEVFASKQADKCVDRPSKTKASCKSHNLLTEHGGGDRYNIVLVTRSMVDKQGNLFGKVLQLIDV